MSFPKHEWLRAVARDKRLDDSYARVAMDLSTSTSIDDGTFCVRQKTVAERLGRDVRSVKRAYAALKLAGYIEWVAAGKRGRGYLSGDTWRLRFPHVRSGDAGGTTYGSGDDFPQVGSGDARGTTSVSGDAGGQEVVTPVAISGDAGGQEVVTTQAADLLSEQRELRSVVLNEGLYGGLEGGAAPAESESLDAEGVPDPANDLPAEKSPRNSETATSDMAPWVRGPYGPRCRKHVNHPDPPKCHGCRDAREADEAEQAAAADRSRVERQARRDAIADCPDCDEYGQIDHGEAGVANCRHPNLSPVAGDQEPA
ncbi:Uncharacterised protein [Mycobacteroides abscessus subsp. massiliense]|uniref:hypothetical protein n=1 Tax=Mycobacteroides abscessus TaxID=36809 RepID=UPI0009A5D988|nr:hypothetical protein [Mycobacteroides abscessus]SLE60997.1 Uncharacterised protein [Mycobacteroides abscessus subsp. massiliense]